MSAWTWFFLMGLAVCGLIGRYSVAQGDYAWAAVCFGTAVVLGIFAIYEVSKGWPKSEAPANAKRCGDVSGMWAGYRCDLDKGHEGEHEAVIARTTDDYSGREVGRKTAKW